MLCAMTLLDFLETRTPDQRQRFLRKLKRGRKFYHPNSIRSCAVGRRQPSSNLALLIEQHSDGLVQRWELRPDIWEKPESIKANGSSRPQRKARAIA